MHGDVGVELAGGCGLSFIRISWAARRTSAFGASRASSSAICLRSGSGNISACGNVSRKIGSSGTADQSINSSTT